MFLDVLPDPNVKINTAGLADAAGSPGPGFLSETISCVRPIERDRAIDGFMARRTTKHARWEVAINYNPMTLTEFSPVYNFLMQKRGSRKAFYVSLPQYKVPKDPTFASYAANNTILATESKSAGSMTLEIATPTGAITTGDVFNIVDSDDSTHVQSYMVARVETAALNEIPPTGGSVRIHFFPGLQKAVNTGAEVRFDNPLFKVRQKQDIQEYQLDSEGLYAIKVQFEEALT